MEPVAGARGGPRQYSAHVRRAIRAVAAAGGKRGSLASAGDAVVVRLRRSIESVCGDSAVELALRDRRQPQRFA